MKDWDVFIKHNGEFKKYRRIHLVSAEKECDALHKAKHFFTRRQRIDNSFYPETNRNDVVILPVDRPIQYRTGCYEHDCNYKRCVM